MTTYTYVYHTIGRRCNANAYVSVDVNAIWTTPVPVKVNKALDRMRNVWEDACVRCMVVQLVTSPILFKRKHFVCFTVTPKPFNIRLFTDPMSSKADSFTLCRHRYDSVATIVTLCEMYCDNARLCVCASPHVYTTVHTHIRM